MKLSQEPLDQLLGLLFRAELKNSNENLNFDFFFEKKNEVSSSLDIYMDRVKVNIKFDFRNISLVNFLTSAFGTCNIQFMLMYSFNWHSIFDHIHIFFCLL